MDPFLHALIAMPTAVYSGLLALVLLYWLSVIVGALDLDLLHLGGHGHVDVGHGGVGHGGAGHSGGHLPHGGAAGHGHDTAVGAHAAHGFFEFLSLGQVPITITATGIVFLAWLQAMALDLGLRATVEPWVGHLLFAVLLAAVFVPAVIVTAYAVRPLRRVFTMHDEHGEASLVGRPVRITSLVVDQGFGTAAVAAQGPELLLNVVCREGVRLAKHDMAVVVEYLADRAVYVVAPYAHLEPDAVEGPLRPPADGDAAGVAAPAAGPVSLESRRAPPQ